MLYCSYNLHNNMEELFVNSARPTIGDEADSYRKFGGCYHGSAIVRYNLKK